MKTPYTKELMKMTEPAAKKRIAPKVSYKPLFWLLALPLLNIVYTLQNGPEYAVHSLVTEVDRNTPFIPAFGVPYLLLRPFLILVFFMVLRHDKQRYYRTVLALCLGLCVANLTYFFFQTTVPRPDVSDGFFNGLISYVYATDEPYNCFPSIHVISSMLMILSSRTLGWKKAIPIGIFGLSIIAATLFIKQHVIADVLAGILVASFSFWASAYLLPLAGRLVAGRNKKAESIRYAE